MAPCAAFENRRVAFAGKFAGLPKRDAQRLLREQGATLADRIDASVQLVVVGEADLPQTALDELERLLDDDARQAVEAGTLDVITETQLWQRLGLGEEEQSVHRLYTLAMLARLLDTPVSVLRRWQRRGLIRPVKEVRRLAYFDYCEVTAARCLAELLAAGVSAQAIERQLASLQQLLPGVERPLTQLTAIVEGKNILLRGPRGPIDFAGQRRLDFDATEQLADEDRPSTSRHLISLAEARKLGMQPGSLAELLEWAADLEDDEQFEAAIEMYRAAMASGGLHAEMCFQLAELLYRIGQAPAAIERYYMAIELDEDFVEARANLGCVLAETGQTELAIAAFEGALSYHHDYPDVHYHLATALDELGRREEADPHWHAFLALAPDSPWSQEARERVGERGQMGKVT